MKGINPSVRHAELDSVLQFDSETQSLGKGAILSVGQRITINQERAAIFAGNYEFESTIEFKIQDVLIIIKNTRWKAEKPIEYSFNPYQKI